MNKQHHIMLGERSFPVRPFTFDELEIVLPLFDDAWSKSLLDGAFEPARDIIRLALGNQITPEDFKDLRVTPIQIRDAVIGIATVAGLALVGEAQAQTETVNSTGSALLPTSAPKLDGTGEPSDV